MIVVNFSHPLTDSQRQEIVEITGKEIAQLIEVLAAFDTQQEFLPQTKSLIEKVGLTAKQWQTEPILLVLPSLNFIAAMLLAELHGRMGYFPPIVRLQFVEGAMPRQFSVAEIIDLQQIRNDARTSRAG